MIDTDLPSARPVQAQIDLSAISANVRAVSEMVGPSTGVMAVVKANGYGLGAAWVARAAVRGSAVMLAVACVDEGVQLRRAGVSHPIIVLSYIAPDEAPAAVASGLAVTLHSARTAVALQEAARRMGAAPRSIAVHIKVDTGLGRYGCTPDEVLLLARAVAECDRLYLQGLMTHFASADSPDLSFAREQLGRFNDVRRKAADEGLTFEIVHAANSAAAMFLPEARFDMVRIGIVLSGNSPTPEVAAPITLHRALSLRSILARVFDVSSGDTVGYGRTWSASEPGRVGLIPIGYADGYSRALSNRADALVRERRCPVIGRVSMDQCAIDVSSVPDVQEGDEVVIIGRQGGEEITVDELARLAGTISYEVLCGISERVPRHYFSDGRRVEVCDLLECHQVRPEADSQKELSR